MNPFPQVVTLCRSDLIYLGACAIYAANDAKSYRLALDEAAAIHREQHKTGIPNCPTIPPPPPKNDAAPVVNLNIHTARLSTCDAQSFAERIRKALRRAPL